MKPRLSNQRTHALTLVEVLVVIVVLAVLVAIILPGLAAAKRRHSGPNCVSNIKQIGLAFQIWAGDNNGKFPMEVSVTNGGAMEPAATGNVVAIFLVISNELGTPKILVCPADVDHVAAANFTTDFNNSKISYFVGMDADLTHPQMLLSGDDNFETGGVSLKSGLFGISTNTSIAWTAERHKFDGNIGLADNSVQQLNTEGLQNALRQTGLATNRLAIP